MRAAMATIGSSGAFQMLAAVTVSATPPTARARPYEIVWPSRIEAAYRAVSRSPAPLGARRALAWAASQASLRST